jgi:O-glycosyl hydrolase
MNSLTVKKRYYFIVLFISFSVFSQTNIITINPIDLKQKIIFGGDAKLPIKKWAEGNTNTVSQKLYGDMNLKVLRVPIFALQPITDAIYDNVITVINSVKAKNPNVKIFASIANGDGYGTDYHGATKFPTSWIGCCASNVYSLNLTTYAAYLDSFMTRMTNAGVTIDYLGPWNEDDADDSDHFKVFSQMTKLGSTQKVGLERWGLQTSVNDVDGIEDQIDITGSHFYDDTTISESNWDSKWASLISTSANPVWYTEATRYKTDDSIDNLIAGMDNIFPAIKGGAQSIIFYQVCPRFVYANGTTLPIKYTGFQNLVNNAEGNIINSTSNNSAVKVIAFGNGTNVDVHIINKNLTDSSFDLQFSNGYWVEGIVNRKTWSPHNTGFLTTFSLTGNTGFNASIPANSYVHLKIPLNKAVLSSKSTFEKDQELTIVPNPSNGNFHLNLPKINNSENVTIKIFSLDAKEVYSESRQYEPSIELNKKITTGIYILSVKANNTIYYTKFIINN